MAVAAGLYRFEDGDPATLWGQPASRPSLEGVPGEMGALELECEWGWRSCKLAGGAMSLAAIVVQISISGGGDFWFSAKTAAADAKGEGEGEAEVVVGVILAKASTLKVKKREKKG